MRAASQAPKRACEGVARTAATMRFVLFIYIYCSAGLLSCPRVCDVSWCPKRGTTTACVQAGGGKVRVRKSSRRSTPLLAPTGRGWNTNSVSWGAPRERRFHLSQTSAAIPRRPYGSRPWRQPRTGTPVHRSTTYTATTPWNPVIRMPCPLRSLPAAPLGKSQVHPSIPGVGVALQPRYGGVGAALRTGRCPLAHARTLTACGCLARRACLSRAGGGSPCGGGRPRTRAPPLTLIFSIRSMTLL